MLRRRPLTVVATAALLLSAGGTAFADDTLPGSDTALVEVYVPSEADVDKLAQSYDLAEYKRVEDDGPIVLNIDADPAERGALRADGLQDRRARSRTPRRAPRSTRSARRRRPRRSSPATWPRTACRRAAPSSRARPSCRRRARP